jgi:hypothetical protein
MTTDRAIDRPLRRRNRASSNQHDRQQQPAARALRRSTRSQRVGGLSRSVVEKQNQQPNPVPDKAGTPEAQKE